MNYWKRTILASCACSLACQLSSADVIVSDDFSDNEGALLNTQVTPVGGLSWEVKFSNRFDTTGGEARLINNQPTYAALNFGSVLDGSYTIETTINTNGASANLGFSMLSVGFAADPITFSNNETAADSIGLSLNIGSSGLGKISSYKSDGDAASFSQDFSSSSLSAFLNTDIRLSLTYDTVTGDFTGTATNLTTSETVSLSANADPVAINNLDYFVISSRGLSTFSSPNYPVFDDFLVTSTIPEPSTTVALAGALVFAGCVFMRRKK